MREGGFTRFEFLLVTSMIFVIAGLFYACTQRGTGDRALRVCANNQREIGAAFAGFMRDHDGNLPHAEISTNRYPRCSWDVPLRYYLSGGALKTNTPYTFETRKLGQAVRKWFRCPEDTVPRVDGGGTRSYAMPRHRARQSDWPPSAKSESGVGLVLRFDVDENGELKLPRWQQATETNRLTYINQALFSDPADTMLLTERCSFSNAVYESDATIDHIAEHSSGIVNGAHHQGVINYLMTDGQVQTLKPALTVGWEMERNGVKWPGGIWSIRAGD